jgi:hypothetical protein
MGMVQCLKLQRPTVGTRDRNLSDRGAAWCRIVPRPPDPRGWWRAGKTPVIVRHYTIAQHWASVEPVLSQCWASIMGGRIQQMLGHCND